MNSGKHDFFITLCCQIFYFFNDFLWIFTADSSSCVRNDTIRTELITTILYFNICSCMLVYLMNY